MNFLIRDVEELFLNQELELIPIVSKNNIIIKIITWSEFFSKKTSYK